jgi:hypothetical protein
MATSKRSRREHSSAEAGGFFNDRACYRFVAGGAVVAFGPNQSLGRMVKRISRLQIE